VTGSAACGLLYFAQGGRYLAEAAVSAASVRRHMPGLRTAIFCDGEVVSDLFDIRDRLVPGLPVKRQKMQALLRSPFERTLFLDTDTLVADPIWELFDLLDRFELAMALSPYWAVELGQPRDSIGRHGVPVSFPKVNSGVIAFRSTPSVRRLIEAWDQLHADWGGQGQDQDPLRVALYESELRWAPLPPAYNYRLPFPSAIRGGVKIFHGRHPDLAALCATINASNAFRATAPARSPVLRYGTETLEPSMRERLGPLTGHRLVRRLGRKAGKLLRGLRGR
jgi:hypothetical protein